MALQKSAFPTFLARPRQSSSFVDFQIPRHELIKQGSGGPRIRPGDCCLDATYMGAAQHGPPITIAFAHLDVLAAPGAKTAFPRLGHQRGSPPGIDPPVERLDIFRRR